MDTVTTVEHPHDLAYLAKRDMMLEQLYRLTPQQLDRKLRYEMAQPFRDDHQVSRRVVQEMHSAPYVPSSVKGILDSTSGTTGSVLIRQDLEPTLYASF